jgi:hypothetical protein
MAVSECVESVTAPILIDADRTDCLQETIGFGAVAQFLTGAKQPAADLARVFKTQPVRGTPLRVMADRSDRQLIRRVLTNVGSNEIEERIVDCGGRDAAAIKDGVGSRIEVALCNGIAAGACGGV